MQGLTGFHPMGKNREDHVFYYTEQLIRITETWNRSPATGAWSVSTCFSSLSGEQPAQINEVHCFCECPYKVELLKTTEGQTNTSVSSAGINDFQSAPPSTTAAGQTINQVSMIHTTLSSIIVAA